MEVSNKPWIDRIVKWAERCEEEGLMTKSEVGRFLLDLALALPAHTEKDVSLSEILQQKLDAIVRERGGVDSQGMTQEALAQYERIDAIVAEAMLKEKIGKLTAEAAKAREHYGCDSCLLDDNRCPNEPESMGWKKCASRIAVDVPKPTYCYKCAHVDTCEKYEGWKLRRCTMFKENTPRCEICKSKNNCMVKGQRYLDKSKVDYKVNCCPGFEWV